MKTTRTITVDSTVGACYIKLSDRSIVRTEEFSAEVLVDLDEYDVVVGIEVLDLATQVSLTDLCRQLHIHKDDEPYLAEFLPNLRHSPRFDLRSSSDSTITARTTRPKLLAAAE